MHRGPPVRPEGLFFFRTRRFRTITHKSDAGGVPHNASYQAGAGVLTRTIDGGHSITLARGVSAVAFSRSGKTVTASLTVQAGSGQVKSTSVKAVYRGL